MKGSMCVGRSPTYYGDIVGKPVSRLALGLVSAHYVSIDHNQRVIPGGGDGAVGRSDGKRRERLDL